MSIIVLMSYLECLKAACFTFSVCAGNKEGFRIRRPDLIPISITS